MCDYPCSFPAFRDFPAETGSLETASTAIYSVTQPQSEILVRKARRTATFEDVLSSLQYRIGQFRERTARNSQSRIWQYRIALG